MNTTNNINVHSKIGLYALKKLQSLIGLELIWVSSNSGSTIFAKSEFFFEDRVNLFFKDESYQVYSLSLAIDCFNFQDSGITAYQMKLAFSESSFNMEDLHFFSKGMSVSTRYKKPISKIEIYGIKYEHKMSISSEDENQNTAAFYGFDTPLESEVSYNLYNIDLDYLILFTSSDEEKMLIMSNEGHRTMQVIVDNEQIYQILNQASFLNGIVHKGYTLQHMIG